MGHGVFLCLTIPETMRLEKRDFEEDAHVYRKEEESTNRLHASQRPRRCDCNRKAPRNGHVTWGGAARQIRRWGYPEHERGHESRHYNMRQHKAMHIERG